MSDQGKNTVQFSRALLRHSLMLVVLAAPSVGFGAQGSLFPGQIFPVANGPLSVATADLNGDGAADIVTGNYLASSVSVLLASGGSYGQAVHYPIDGSRVYAVALADMNGDSNPDIVTANYLSGNVSVFLGDGTGAFAAATSYFATPSIRSLAVADVDGDGDQDIIAGDNLLLGDGTGGLGATTSLGFFSFDSVLKDLDGNGKPDLVATDSVSVSVRLSDGIGGFNPAVLQFAGNGAFSLAVADINGDGDNDVVTANADDNTISVLLGNGTDTLAAAVPYNTGTTPRGIAVADFNADGALDVATANIGSDDISLLLADGAGGFAAPAAFPVGSNPYSLVLTDANDDGNTDILVANYSGDYLSILFGDGTGGFSDGVNEHPVGDAAASVVVGELTGDGSPDLVTANLVSDNISLLSGDGTGGFAAQTLYPAGDGPSDIALADVNDDGIADALTANPLLDSISVMLGTSAGDFAAAEQYAAGNGTRSLTVGDMDDDGALDVVTANFGGDDVSVLLGDGDGAFGSSDDDDDDEGEDDKIGGAASSHYAVGDGPRAITLADVNADGSLDALTINMASEDVSVLLGDGNGGFTGVEDYLAGDGPSDLALGDINDDGHLDVLVTNFDGDDVSVLLGTDTGSFNEASSFRAGDGPRSLELYDVNDDAILDAVVANFDSDTLSVLLGDGAGSFHTPLFYQVGDGPISLTMTDFNADGRKDIAVANENADSVSILLQQNIAPVALGGSLTAAMNGVETEKLHASDPNGDDLVFELVALAKHGAVTLIDAKTGMYSYVPTTGYSGVDGFVYKASDGQADSAAQTINITVEKSAGEESGGGGMGVWTILMLPLLALRRRSAALPDNCKNNNVNNVAKGRVMYRFSMLVLLGFMGQSYGATAVCTGGIADGHACDKIDLLSHLSIPEIGGGNDVDQNGMPIEWVSDMWGWVDDQGTPDIFTDDREYAIVGRFCGTSFIDITDPENPVYLGNLPDHSEFVTGHNACQELSHTKLAGLRQSKMHETDGSIWRDIKVYDHYAVIVAETNIGQGEDAPHNGLQIFDLLQLRDLSSSTLPVLFPRSSYTHYDGFGNSHNVFVNQLTGHVYAVGSNQCGGGLHIVDINDPDNPVEAGCYAGLGYTHDAQCVIYTGPDAEHVGQEICFGSNGNVGGPNTLAILDATNPAAVTEIANAGYVNSAYSHQGWLSEDQQYFFLNDELDEIYGSYETVNPVPKTRLLIWDVSDLENPALVTQFQGRTGSTEHNNYVQGNYLYESNYTAGLNVLDITDPENPVEVGYFDNFIPFDTPDNTGTTTPGDTTDDDAFLGTWSNYPWYPSGTVAVSDITGGLYVVKPEFGDPDRISTANINGSARALDANVDATGEPVEFEMIVKNFGPDATNSLTAVIRISNASLTSIDTGSAPVTCAVVTGTANILCTGQQLAAGESYVVDIAAVTDSDADVQAEIFANAYNVDITEADNSDKAVVVVGKVDEDDDGDEDDDDDDDDEEGDNDDGGGSVGLLLLLGLLGAGLMRRRIN